MRISMQRLAARFGVLFAGVGLSLIFGAATASAATITWAGANGGDLSAASNWSPASVPTSVDDVVFNATGMSAFQTLINTAPITIKSLTLSGGNASSYGYTLGGSTISVSGGITNSSTSSISFTAGLTLTADQTFGGSGSINPYGTINLNGHNLTISSIVFAVGTGAVTGTGNITITTGGSFGMPDSSPSWTGSLILASGSSATVLNGGGLGNVANVINIASGGVLGFCGATGATVNQPITLGGTGISAINSGAITSNAGCYGAGTGNGNITLAGAITLSADTTVGTDGTLTITGPITGAHTLTMAPGSAGTLVINSSNNQSSTPNGTYTAPLTNVTYSANSPSTTINLGTNQTGVVTGTYGDVSVSGGTLKGTGTIGNLSMYAGVVAPGMSPGILNASNTQFSGGTYQEELGGTAAGTFDQLNVTGTVDIGANVTVLDTSLYGTFKPKAGDSFKIINNDLADPITGNFKGLVEGATFTVSGYVLKISYVGGDGNDVVLTVQSVPALPKTGFNFPLANIYLVLFATISMAGVLGFAAWKLNSNNHLL